jgi:hypothetical protein
MPGTGTGPRGKSVKAGEKAAAARKTTAAKRAKKPEDQRSRLLRMLSEAAVQVDDEGLLFLVRQANVLVHNRRVDDVNREQEELAGREREPESAARPGVAIEDDGERAAVFVSFNGVRKVLDREEVKRLVRICYGAESRSEALRQLHTVLKRERADIVNDARMAGPTSPVLGQLFEALRERYRLEDR